MPPVAVHHLELQKQTSDLVMATHGRGVIILDDISPLRQLTVDVLTKNVHFFAPKAVIINEESGFGGHSTEMEYVGPNPDRDAKIVYYLKKRHIFGKTKMQVFDADGKVIADLPANKSKGINTVSWNGQLKRPKIAKAKTFALSGGFAAPRVPAGSYKVVFTKGKESYETQVILKNDPKSPYTNQQRADLHKVTMELYDLTESLAYLVYQVDAYVDSGNQQADTADKNTKAMVEKLTALKETLVVTTGDNYVGTADPQLREDLATLFGKLASGFAPPSKPEQANMKLIKGRFSKAQKNFNKINKKEIKAYLKSGKVVEIKPFDEFVKLP
jgi:hypothetical protein